MDDTPSPPFARRFAYGNRCGHDPNAPRIQPQDIPAPTGRNPQRTPFIDTFRARLTRLYFKVHDAALFETSQADRRKRLKKQRDAAADPLDIERLQAALDKDRQQRSERREAKVIDLSFLGLYTDVATRLVGIPTAEGFRGISARWIGQHTGVSLSRTQRSLATLDNEALLITVDRGRQRDAQGRWQSYGALRQVTWKLIDLLTLRVAWTREQKRLRKHKAASEPQEPTVHSGEVRRPALTPPRTTPPAEPPHQAPRPPLAPPPPPRERESERKAAQSIAQQRTQHFKALLDKGVPAEQAYQLVKDASPYGFS